MKGSVIAQKKLSDPETLASKKTKKKFSGRCFHFHFHRCWLKKPDQRPNFTDLGKLITEEIKRVDVDYN